MRRTFALALTLVALALIPLARPGAAADQPTRLLLPLVATDAPRSMLGLEVSSTRDASWVSAAASLAPGWLRLSTLSWREVEPTPDGGYRWDGPATAAIEARMIRASELGLPVVLVLHDSPDWAVAPYGANCAPINPQHYARFARFAAAAVARYGAPPYNVRHFEIGNEPDAYIFENDSPYGCWGRRDDPYYGGREYGELLKAVYPAVKAADGRAQVLNGGLLLDGPYNASTGEGLSGRFLEGMLVAGAGGSFDILAYHSYSYAGATPNGTLGAQDWKPGYLRGVLARYGVQKPLFNNESALLCREATPGCALDQAYVIPRLYVRALRDGLIGQIWYLYDNDSFHHTALVEPDNPALTRPGHSAFAQASRALTGLGYAGPIPGLPAGAEGYRLAAPGRATLVLWSDTPQAVQLDVGAAGQVTCAAWDGATLACAPTGGTLTLSVGPGPVYVTLTSLVR